MKHLEMTIALYKYNWTEFQQLQVAPYRKQTMSQVKKCWKTLFKSRNGYKCETLTNSAIVGRENL